MKIFLIIIVCLAVITVTLTTLTGTNYIYKALRYLTADIDDYKIFDNNIVTSGVTQPIPNSSQYKKIEIPNEVNAELEKLIQLHFLF